MVGVLASDYVDTGLGWYAYNDFVFFDAGYSYTSGVAPATTKVDNGACIAAAYFLPNKNKYDLVSLSTNQSYSYLSTHSYRFSVIIDNRTWYCDVSTQYGTSLTGAPVVNCSISSFRWDNGGSNSVRAITEILNSAGFTTDSSVIPPSTLFVAGTYNNLPIQVQYGPIVTEPVFTSSIDMSASYNLYDSSYTPVVFSSDFTNMSGINLKYQVQPRNYNAEYVCFETMSYSDSQYSSITISGEFTFYIQSQFYPLVGGQDSKYIYPDSSSLIVNGERVYTDVQSLGNGVFRYSGTVDLSQTGSIVSIGVWSSFTDSFMQLGATSFDVGFFGSNNLTITPNSLVVSTPDPNTSLGDIQVDTSSIEGKIDTEIGKQDSIIGMLRDIPQNIGSTINKAFVPDAQVLDDYSVLYGNLLEDKLGFVWQAGTLILTAVSDFQGYLAGEITPHPLTFPGISFPMNGSTITILQPTQVDLNNDLMQVLQPWLERMVDFVCTIAFLNTCRDMMVSIASGASYMEYLHRGRGKDDSD